MYAVIISGGKQYRVKVGQLLDVEKIELEPGTVVEFDKVLMAVDGDKVQLGTPFLAVGKVLASIETHGRHDKVKILKFRRRKHHMKHMGHRQWFTRVKITEIKVA